MKHVTRACTVLLVVSLLSGVPTSAQTREQDAAANAKCQGYIDSGWDTLSRSMSDCKSLVDIKVTTDPVLYLPAGMPTPAAVAAAQQQCHVSAQHLPRRIAHMGDVRVSQLPVEGLLYLPNRHLVPGDRFNELYDSRGYAMLLRLLPGQR